ncbi:MAG: hypothetical protein ACFFEY_00125 [Candidatus Thorarchaeota archaeon]
MEYKKYLNLYLIGLVGSLFLIASEFLQWFSEYNLMEIFIITNGIAIEDSFLFLFPLMSGIICSIASILVIYQIKFKIKSVIVSFIGLGFFLIFLIDYIIQVIQYLPTARIGFYFGIIGFLLVLFNILNLLITSEKDLEAS